MKKTLFALGIGLCAFAQPASAIVITIDTNTADTFAFDLVWGPTYVPQGGFDTDFGVRANGGNGGGVSGGEVGDINTFVGGMVETPTTKYPGGVWVAGFEFDFTLLPDGSVDRHFVSVNNFTDEQPTTPASVSVIADGFGVHIVYDFSNIDQELAAFEKAQQDKADKAAQHSVSDTGSSVTLMACSLCALGFARGLHRLRNKTAGTPQ